MSGAESNWWREKWEDMKKPHEFVPLKPDEIEDQDPLKLGLGGDCNIALEILLEFFPSANPHRLTNDKNGWDHVFLIVNGQSVDISGITSLEKMRAHYQDETLRAEPVQMREIRRAFKGHRDSDEIERLKAHFKQYILKTREAFPPFD